MPSLIPVTSGRRTLAAWWCPSGHRNEGTDRLCWMCSHGRVERHAQVHSSERTVYYQHPLTGQIVRPGRADQPMHPNYAREGFERKEVLSMIAHERETGSVHEASNFAPGSEPSPDGTPATPKAPKELINSIIDDLRAANQSGPWTMEQPLADGMAED